MFPLAVVLGIACYRSDFAVWRYVLPLATLGWLIALYHSLLYWGGIPASLEPCGEGVSCSSAAMRIAGFPIPGLSLAAFTLDAWCASPNGLGCGGHVQKAGIVTYVRGHITILDRKALENASCECYRLIQRHYRGALAG